MPDTWPELRKHLQAGEKRAQQRWLGLRGCCSHRRGRCPATGRDTAVPQHPQGASVPPPPPPWETETDTGVLHHLFPLSLGVPIQKRGS